VDGQPRGGRRIQDLHASAPGATVPSRHGQGWETERPLSAHLSGHGAHSSADSHPDRTRPPAIRMARGF
jgi:hypothetical protein